MGGQCSVSHEGATGGMLMCWLMIARRVVADEGRPAGDHLVEHRAEGVEVRLWGALPAKRLLRRHVSHGPQHHPVLREPGAVEGDRQSEVANLGRAVGGDEDVGGLEVAVDEAAAMDEGEATADVLRDGEGAFHRQAVVLGLLKEPGDIPAAHELFDDERRAVVVADVVDGDEVGMTPEASHRLRFTVHPFVADEVEPVCADRAEGHLAVEAAVVSEEDALASTFAEEALDAVAAGDEGRWERGFGDRRGEWANGRLGDRR